MEEKDFFPLGASRAPFWRAMNPDPADWEKEMTDMKEAGMTCASVFAPWHRIEREEGKFDFSDLDRVFDIAEKLGMKLTVGLGVHVTYSYYTPRWLMRNRRARPRQPSFPT